jgi:translocation and assembly module TamB
MEGRLKDRLLLEGVTVRSGRKTASIGRLVFQWRPWWLLTGRLVIDDLLLSAVAVQDDSPPTKKPFNLSWPRLPGMADLVDAEVGRLRINQLRYRRLTGKPLQVKELAMAVFWRDGILSLPQLAIDGLGGKVTGKAAAGFRRPTLALDLAIVPATPLAHLDAVNVSARLMPARSPEQVAGQVFIVGSSKGRSRLEVKTELGVTPHGANLRRLKLFRPGSRGIVTGGGTVDLVTADPQVRLNLDFAHLDLVRELKTATDISGHLTIKGSSKGYHGRFHLANRGKGWREASLAATFTGGDTAIKLASLEGAMLGGILSGNLELDWSGGMAARGRLQGKNLNPAVLAKDWQGEVNLYAVVDVAMPKQGSPRGKAELILLQSQLHGQPLTGGVTGSFFGNNLQIGNLDLHGRGFDLHGGGNLAKRFDVTAVVTDLSRLVPETAGELRLAGWGMWKNGRAGGSIIASGRKLKGRGMGIENLSLEGTLPWGKDSPVHLDASLQKISYRQFQADSVRLVMDGRTSHHLVSLEMAASEASLSLAAAGSYHNRTWQGTIDRFSGRDRVGPWNLHAPAKLQVTSAQLSLAKTTLAGPGRERLEVEAEVTPGQATGDVRLQWDELNLNRATPWLQGMRVAGSSSGQIAATLYAEKRLQFNMQAVGAGSVTSGGRTITLERADLQGMGDEKGIHADVTVTGTEGIGVEARIATVSPARLALPEQGSMSLHWTVPDLAVLEPWMKGSIKVSGRLEGTAKGKFLPENRLALDGDISLGEGNLHWRKPEGEGTMALKDVSVKWSWQGDTLQGKVQLALAEFGQLRGSFILPVPAAFPAAPDPQGAIDVTLAGQVREQGLLSAFMPGLVQETHGLVGMDMGVGGVWQEPRLRGTVQLSQAGAYLPSAGIRLRDVLLAANLDRDRVEVTFRAASGSGQLTGDGVVQLQGRQVASYRGTINGDQFQVIHLPELEASASPQLSFGGNLQKVSVRGEVRLPVLLVHGQPPKASIQPSPDVILEGAPPEKRGPRLAMDVQVRVILGDRVLVKAAGLDAQLGGSMDLSIASLDNIASTGEIKVVKGRYKAYGLDLAIARGRIFYGGGRVNEPLLDVLALRTVGDVRAGVTVTGTPRVPVIKLYSEPTMPDMDILAYMVLGHPLGASTEQAGLVAQAAGLLLSTGQSTVLQDQIKNRLGLSTIEIESGRQDAASRMGYKPIAVTPSGMAPTKEADTGVSQSILTLGKYLTPELYISYGRSLFTGANLFRLRYDISRRLQLETETGSESGVDLYYKMQFN